ncbi:MAG: tRNA (uridine(34)/cytosine(34)/5-carboxymethylaminomethyluridine(34)-2'-O)-methyltransferase TrmL [Clostridiales Family XIII bacterium]|nr:tRNA (uridine(34)/cytosine(34)/5-carboxymethylaminomethyluridine(34)-2'-O)-methyltransferase TrmL [Clostridiales Family XIII bacterium]
MEKYHIVLVEPEIPGNTGNISRTCAATGTKLHLVKPLGFALDEKKMKRAGLDYWDHLDLEIHESLSDFMAKYTDVPMYFLSKYGSLTYSDFEYEEGAMFLFGRETKGLPKDLIADHSDRTLRIPMVDDESIRSLNLSNTAAIVIYEALRQRGFSELR